MKCCQTGIDKVLLKEARPILCNIYFQVPNNVQYNPFIVGWINILQCVCFSLWQQLLSSLHVFIHYYHHQHQSKRYDLTICELNLKKGYFYTNSTLPRERQSHYYFWLIISLKGVACEWVIEGSMVGDFITRVLFTNAKNKCILFAV